MAEAPQFRLGDVVVHTRRPEWGQGVVERASQVMHQGQPGQRLLVSFAHRGRITLNTALAPLASKDATKQMRSSTSSVSSGQGWLGTLSENKDNQEHELLALPEAMTDPFASVGNRLGATLESYRFSTEARCLLDWAIAQTGLQDPLTKYTRHELEEAFRRFARDRDRHLSDLVRQIKRNGKIELLNEALQQSRSAAASQALQEAIRG